MRINIGILGAGRVAQHYVEIFKSIPSSNYKILTIVDKEINKSKKLASYLNCKFSNNYESLLNDRDINLIIILTPSGTHYQQARIALKKGFNILVEKPLAMKPSEIQELVKISKKEKKILSVAFQNRLNPSIKIAKELLKNKKFGKIISSSVRLRWCRFQDYYDDGWHGTWSMDGGVLNQQAIHHLDAINYLLGNVKSVSAFSTKRLNRLEAEDTLVSILNFKDGSLGTIEATTAARPIDLEASLSITGENGYIDISGVALNKIKSIKYKNQKMTSKELSRKYSQKVKNGYGFSHRELLLNIFKFIKGKKTYISDGLESLHTSRIIHSIYESVDQKKTIDIKKNLIYSKLGN